MPSTVYIFRGPPASGKGTIVPRFAEQLPKPVALIEQDSLRWGYHLIGRKVSDVTSDEHRFAYDNMLLLYEQYLKRQAYTIVLEGLFTLDDPVSPEGNVRQLVDLAVRYGYKVVTFLLTADKDELLARNAARKYAVPQPEFDQLYEAVCGKTGEQEIVIDSTGLTAAATIERTLGAATAAV